MEHISGTDFLVFYGISLFAVLGATFILKKLWDNSLTYGIKSVIGFDPYQVAYLRGGAKEVIGVGLVGLINKEGLEKQDEKLAANFSVRTDGIEAILQGNLHQPRSARQIYQDNHILDRAERLCQSYEYELLREKLIFSDHTRKVFKTLRYFYFASFLGVGSFRVFMGFMNEKPVLYLVGLMVLAAISIWFVTKIPRLTQRGECYLQDLNVGYKQKLRDFSEKEKNKKDNPESQTSDQAYHQDSIALAGLFGAAMIVEHNPEYAFIAQEQKRQMDLGNGSGYGGGGDGSSGSSSGDGGGGSSCGGGGCGGCGGGCGGG